MVIVHFVDCVFLDFGGYEGGTSFGAMFSGVFGNRLLRNDCKLCCCLLVREVSPPTPLSRRRVETRVYP